MQVLDKLKNTVLVLIIAKLIIYMEELHRTNQLLLHEDLSGVFIKVFVWVVVRCFGLIDNCQEASDILGFKSE